MVPLRSDKVNHIDDVVCRVLRARVLFDEDFLLDFYKCLGELRHYTSILSQLITTSSLPLTQNDTIF